MTKIMTCYLAILLIEKWDLHQNNLTFKVSEFAGTIQDDQIFLQDLLYGMMLPSGNDAAQVIAENLGAYLYFEQIRHLYKIRVQGDFFLNEEIESSPKDYASYFINEMNKLARRLDLKNTMFSNPHGLDHFMNKSTAQDICELGQNKIQANQYLQLKLLCKIQLFVKYANVSNIPALLDKKMEM